MIYTNDQVKAIVDSRIAEYIEYCGGIDEDYQLGFYVESNDIEYIIIFSSCYKEKVKGIDTDTDYKEIEYSYTNNEVKWLKGGKFIDLFDKVSGVLDKITSNKVEHESK